ncbi:MAG TPA: heavy metal-associated domain-containing protein [Ramlibacter sp.]|nr:heavy metal-associated domain-containing protein [Ramlibacter sp.]
MKHFIVTLALATAAVPALAVESVKATVNGMVCSFCAQGIEKRLSKLPATKAVFVDLKQKVVAVEAKDGQKIDGKLVTAEITEAGYDVTKVETVAKSVADIKAETQAGKAKK